MVRSEKNENLYIFIQNFVVRSEKNENLYIFIQNFVVRSEKKNDNQEDTDIDENSKRKN